MKTNNDFLFTSRRDIWKISKNQEEVSSAITKMIEYHEKKLKFWDNKKDEFLETLKKDGVVIDTSLVEQYGKGGYETSNSLSNNRNRFQVSVDTDLQRKLTETVDKVNLHTQKLKDYKNWKTFVDSVYPNSELELTFDDYVFFFVPNNK